ncbi:MAG: Hsp70 family protein [Geminocystis sp.]|nr:Hsp70 family protein [Geminocystis sp.]HIK38510.1 Hsp70 family protein [Geminocystis sp. M7585_C2015_104]MCS7147537.1 Hsp70 family protein [Geminocystis sp.]MCX8077940.1 Hsp70 family protein [Geminocystis sp.]MDW8115230.1 Hsp70 family protein [Geminocystis sp.]
MTIAIDFGTSNTVVARINPETKETEIVKLVNLAQNNPNIPPVIPSLVYVNNAQEDDVIVGQRVRDRGLDYRGNERFFYNFKRGIGSELQGFLPVLDGVKVTFEKVGEWFLNKIIGELKDVDSLILTVPVDSFEKYRQWLTEICRKWRVERVKIIDEPTAAALGYGREEEGDSRILVMDFGGGTLDFSLVELARSFSKKTQGFIIKWGDKLLGKNSSQKTKLARVIAKAGTNLGGCDIDNWIVDYFHQQQGIVKSSLTTRLAERLKIKLSSETEAQEVYFNDETLETYDLRLSRSTFVEILQNNRFFERLSALMENVLQQAKANGIDKEAIDTVLLVGGSVQIPALREWLQKYFPKEKIKCEHPLDAIARGALKLEQQLEVRDFLYHSYGIRYWNKRKNAHDWHVIIPKGQPIPMPEARELILGASTPNQPSIELVIGELAGEETATEVYFDGERLVTRSIERGTRVVQPLNDRDGGKTIARLEPPGNPGQDRIRVLFRVDENKRLRITVEDLLTERILLDNVVVAELR